MTWLERLKKSETPGARTDKTDRTLQRPLLSVLTVPAPCAVEKPLLQANRPSVVEFRLVSDAPGRWHTALGPSVQELIADLRSRYGTRLESARPKLHVNTSEKSVPSHDIP
jgi:hypothetical protein